MGGYQGWLLDKLKDPQAPVNADGEEESVAKRAEKSIRKKFHKSIWCKFTKAINEYELVKPGDKIAV